MANEHLFKPYLAAATFDAAQGDPNASLGGFKSSTVIADEEGTFTTVTSDRVVIDTGLPGGDFVGGWVVFLDTNLNEVREIIAYNTGTKEMTFREVLPSTPLVSDRYWLFLPNGLFDQFDADECRRRATKHRLGYFYNSTGSQIDEYRCFVREIKAGPLVCDIGMAIHASPQNEHFDVVDLSDQEDPPDLQSPVALGGAPQTFGDDGSQDFLHPRTRDGAGRSPYGTEGPGQSKTIRDSGTSVHADRPMWIRLSFNADSPIPLPTQAVFQVYVDGDDGTVIPSFLVVVDLAGVPEVITPVIDRRLRIAGGARLSCIVTDAVDPFEAVPGRTISIELTSGPGSMGTQGVKVQQDDGEPIRRVYLSSTDPADVGQVVTFGFEVT